MQDKARGVAARGMVPQGPEDVAGKSRRDEDQHQVKQDRRCSKKEADLHSGACVHHVVKSVEWNYAIAVLLGFIGCSVHWDSVKDLEQEVDSPTEMILL